MNVGKIYREDWEIEYLCSYMCGYNIQDQQVEACLKKCLQREREIPLKNGKWQTDQVAHQHEMQVWILHSQHLASRHEVVH